MSTNKIFTLIPKIMAEVGAIEKTRRNTTQGQGYAFRGIDDVYLALQGPLSKHGVFYAPNVLEVNREERQTKSGGNLIYTVLKVEFSFYADDGSTFKVVTYGEAMDSGDKSCNKAMSAALKYALLQTFCIPTEEDKDTENDSPEPSTRKGQAQTGQAPQAKPSPLAPVGQQVPRVTHQHLGQLFALIKSSGWSNEAFRDYLKETTGLDSTRDMSPEQYQQCMSDLQTLPPPGSRSAGLPVGNTTPKAPALVPNPKRLPQARAN